MRTRSLVLAAALLVGSFTSRATAQEALALESPRPPPPGSRTNQPIVALGLAIWTTTYLPSLLIGQFAGLQFATCNDLDGPFDVPFGATVGAVAIVACNRGDAWGSDVAFGLAFGIGQLVGVVVTVLGATVFRLRVPSTAWTASGLVFAF